MRKDLEKRYENIDLLKSNYKEREAQFDAAKKVFLPLEGRIT